MLLPTNPPPLPGGIWYTGFDSTGITVSPLLRVPVPALSLTVGPPLLLGRPGRFRLLRLVVRTEGRRRPGPRGKGLSLGSGKYRVIGVLKSPFRGVLGRVQRERGHKLYILALQRSGRISPARTRLRLRPAGRPRLGKGRSMFL